jgi:phosphoribosylanthranilate isomerase
MHIKICGITNIEDALHAVQAGASHLGIIFVQESPRYVTPEDAQKIVAAVKSTAVVVGVFQNHSAEAIAEIVVKTGIDAIQLHGAEDPAFCRSIGLRLGKPVIKTIILQSDKLESPDERAARQSLLTETITSFGSPPDQSFYLLFDKAKGSPVADWMPAALAQVAAIEKQKDFLLPPYFFAGSLTPGNIQGVLETISPFALDVASGVESSPRQKDPALVSAFIAKAKNPTTPSLQKNH